MSDLTFDDAMESYFVIYNEENTYAAGPEMVQEYRGGALKLISPFRTLNKVWKFFAEFPEVSIADFEFFNWIYS